MSYEVDAAPKKALPPSVLRTGASPGCVAATLLFCAGGGALFLTIVVGGAIAFAVYASQAERTQRVDAQGQVEKLQARIEQQQARMGQKIEGSSIEASQFEPIPLPAFSDPAPLDRTGFPGYDFPRGPRFHSRSFEPSKFHPIEFEHRFSPSAFERPASNATSTRFDSSSGSFIVSGRETSRLPLIMRPASVTNARSMSRPPRIRSVMADEMASTPVDLCEFRAERLQAFLSHPAAFAREAEWFAERRPSLSDATLMHVEETIAEFIVSGDSAEAVRALPTALSWYGRSNLAALGRLLLHQVEFDSPHSSTARRQILVGTFQRYRTLDLDWRDPAAGDVLRALTRSTTIASHAVPSIEALHPPFPAPVADFLIDFSFAPASESMYAQRKALINRPTRERLLDEAVAKLESTDEAERESAYVILASVEPTPARADAVLDAICHAFAQENVDPSPAAHAALACWMDREHAADFRAFCESECPIRRLAARSAIARFPAAPETLAVSTTARN